MIISLVDVQLSYRFTEMMVDNSAIAIILLYLNCEFDALRLERYLPELECFQIDKPVTLPSTEHKPGNWRNLFTVLTQLKLLKKLIHRNNLRLRILVKSKATHICKHVLSIPHDTIRLYCLKIFKQILKFLNRKWKSGNSSLLHSIYSESRI